MGKTQKKKSRAKPFVYGLILGAVLAALAIWMVMPNMMLVVHQSRYDTIEETCRQLQAAIAVNGWTSPPVRSMNAAMAKNGVQMDRQVRIVELCKADYAREVLTTNPEVSTLMPCAWGVYQDEAGTVYISGMNMGLMGKMFGGKIAEIMGGAVAGDEKNILREIIRE